GRNVRETLRNFAFSFRDFSLQPAERAINALVASSECGFIMQETQRIWGEIARDLSAHLEDARKRGEIRDDINPVTVVASLMASISGLVVLAKMPPSDSFIAELVALHLDGCAGRTASHPGGE